MSTMQQKTVMLVEDDAAMKSVLTTFLELEGFQVLAAPEDKNLDEILHAIQIAKPDMLLLDVHIGMTSGFDVIERLRKDSQIGQTRVVMTSGMDAQDSCIAAGADAFLLKPYMPDELISKLKG